MLLRDLDIRLVDESHESLPEKSGIRLRGRQRKISFSWFKIIIKYF